MREQQGFTLIEIVISIAIISIALVTLVSVMNRSIATAAESSALTGGVMLAQEKLSMVGAENDGFLPATGVSAWEKDDRYPRLTYRVMVEETALPDARQVTVQVRHDGREIFSLERYLLRR